MEIDKDAYVKAAEQMVEVEGFTPVDIGNLLAFVQSSAGKKLVGTMSIEARNSIMQMGNIDFHSPNAPLDAQALRAGALALNTFIDTILGLVEDPEPEEKPE
jgi:hypothetical protein